MLDTAMTAWIGYAALSLIMASLAPVLIRSGARRTAPTVGALFYTGLVSVFLLEAVLLDAETPVLSAVSGRDALYIAGAALATGFSCLCLFRAFATGLVTRVAPLMNLSFAVLFGVGFVLRERPFSLFAGIYLLVFLLGTVLMIAVSHRYKDPAFLWFAVAAAVLSALSEILLSRTDGAIPAAFENLAAYAGAFCICLVFALIGRSFRTLTRMNAESALFSLSAGVAMGLSFLARYYSGLYGLWSELRYISALPLPLTVLFAAIFGREKLNASCIFGLIIVLGGMVALIIQAG